MKEFSHGFETGSPFSYSFTKDKSKNMRREPTVAEIRLWECLRAKQLGVKFRRQHVIDDYIADFICLNEMLIIEVDGEYHDTPEQQESDSVRTAKLNTLGFRVIRFTNDQILFQIEEVLEQIRKSILFTDISDSDIE